MPQAGPPFPEITATSTTYQDAPGAWKWVAGHAFKYAFWSSVMLKFGRNTGIPGTGHRRIAKILPARASRWQNLFVASAAAWHVPGLTKTGNSVLFVWAQLPSPEKLHKDWGTRRVHAPHGLH